MILLAMLAALASGGPTVEDASLSDCEILVQVGRAEAAWGQSGPNQPFVDEGPPRPWRRPADRRLSGF